MKLAKFDPYLCSPLTMKSLFCEAILFLDLKIPLTRLNDEFNIINEIYYPPFGS